MHRILSPALTNDNVTSKEKTKQVFDYRISSLTMSPDTKARRQRCPLKKRNLKSLLKTQSAFNQLDA